MSAGHAIIAHTAPRTANRRSSEAEYPNTIPFDLARDEGPATYPLLARATHAPRQLRGRARIAAKTQPSRLASRHRARPDLGAMREMIHYLATHYGEERERFQSRLNRKTLGGTGN